MFQIGRVVFIWVVAVCAAGASADVLYLQNGDRISGTLGGLSNGVLWFRGEFTGPFEVPMAEVYAVTTEEEVELLFRDSLSVMGRLVLLDDRQALAAEGELKPIVLDELVTIAIPGVEIAEAPPPPEPEDEAPKKWSGSITAATAWRKGATDTFDATVGATLVRTWDDDVLTFRSEAAYGEVESLKNTQRVLGELKWQHYWSERFYGYWLGGAEHDAARQLDLRLRTSAGLGHDVIKQERRKLSLEAGIGYRREYWLEYDLVGERRARERSRDARQARLNQFINDLASLRGGQLISASFQFYQDMNALKFDNRRTSEDSVNVRLSSHFEQRVFSQSRFTSDLTYEPDIDSLSDFRVLSDLAFLTPLTEKISLRIRLDSEYDSAPGDSSAENWEHRFLTGLEYRF